MTVPNLEKDVLLFGNNVQPSMVTKDTNGVICKEELENIKGKKHQLLGAINVDDRDLIAKHCKAIDSDSVRNFLKDIGEKYSDKNIYLIMSIGSYYTDREVANGEFIHDKISEEFFTHKPTLLQTKKINTCYKKTVDRRECSITFINVLLKDYLSTFKQKVEKQVISKIFSNDSANIDGALFELEIRYIIKASGLHIKKDSTERCPDITIISKPPQSSTIAHLECKVAQRGCQKNGVKDFSYYHIGCRLYPTSYNPTKELKKEVEKLNAIVVRKIKNNSYIIGHCKNSNNREYVETSYQYQGSQDKGDRNKGKVMEILNGMDFSEEKRYLGNNVEELLSLLNIFIESKDGCACTGHNSDHTVDHDRSDLRITALFKDHIKQHKKWGNIIDKDTPYFMFIDGKYLDHSESNSGFGISRVLIGHGSPCLNIYLDKNGKLQADKNLSVHTKDNIQKSNKEDVAIGLFGREEYKFISGVFYKMRERNSISPWEFHANEKALDYNGSVCNAIKDIKTTLNIKKRFGGKSYG